MSWRAERDFAGGVDAPAAARAFTTAELRRAAAWAAALCDDAVLVVSELVTNAVRASAGPVRLQLALREDALHIRVSDDGDGWPTPRHARDDEAGGRGLQLVGVLAADWGVVPREGGGKHVWATLPVR